MFSKQPTPSSKLKQQELDPTADHLYQNAKPILDRYLQTLETKYCLTLKDSHNPLIIKCQKVKEDLEALQQGTAICTPAFKQRVEHTLSDIETGIDMIPVTINGLRAAERVTFANYKVYPESYMRLVENIDGSIQQTIKIFEDYKNKKSLVLHPKRHHMAEAKKIIDQCKFILKNQDWNLDIKIAETRAYVSKVKDSLIGTLQIKLEDEAKLSSFLKRLHYVLDKLLIVVPPVNVAEQKSFARP
jgi:hypothetical protein